ncbi:hypothetical protein [Synechococcus sp. UW140]|uniref:hypothetical protein n=1 Tax=Synechococcus sp. UW140 TaxID=368503 RepID=UPI0031380BC5
MAIERDVFGSYVEGIVVSVGGININISFAAGGNGDGRWCQLLEGVWALWA